eukprot:scaffold586077_cov17-Prasinocladus_malaysianus.AAC.1
MFSFSFGVSFHTIGQEGYTSRVCRQTPWSMVSNTVIGALISRTSRVPIGVPPSGAGGMLVHV